MPTTVRSGVVGKCVEKAVGGMTGATLGVSDRMRWAGCLTDRHSAVVTAAALTRDVRMVEAAIGFEFQKVGRIVATVAFDRGRYMKLRLADGESTVVALAAGAEDLRVIDRIDDVESHR